MRKLIRRLLFKLHIVNTYPTTLVTGGHEVPATIIRTDSIGHNIRPDITPMIKDDPNFDGVKSVIVYQARGRDGR